MRFQNSSRGVLALSRSSHNILRRISGYNANYHLNPDATACPNAKYDNFHVLDLTYKSSYNLVEDSIFGGSGRNLMTSFGNSNFNIFRRNILVGGGYVRENQIPGCNTPSSSNHGEPSQLYGVSDNVVENVIAFGIGDWEGRKHPQNAGMNVWVNRGEEGHRNKFFGTLVMDYPTYGFYHASVCNTTNANPTADSDECLTEVYYENVVAFRNGMNMQSRNGRNHIIRNATLLNAGEGYSSGSDQKLGIYQDQQYDGDHSSSWSYENILVAGNGRYGCLGTSNLAPQSVTIKGAMFFGNKTGDFDSKCGDTTQEKVTVGVDPQLTSLVYVDPASPAFSAGTGGAPVGADLRCRYISKLQDGSIVTEHTSQSMWPLPASINERVKKETQEIHGTAYDVNAKVLDALGPHDPQKIGCPSAADGPPAAPSGLMVQ